MFSIITDEREIRKRVAQYTTLLQEAQGRFGWLKSLDNWMQSHRETEDRYQQYLFGGDNALTDAEVNSSAYQQHKLEYRKLLELSEDENKQLLALLPKIKSAVEDLQNIGRADFEEVYEWGDVVLTESVTLTTVADFSENASEITTSLKLREIRPRAAALPVQSEPSDPPPTLIRA